MAAICWLFKRHVNRKGKMPELILEGLQKPMGGHLDIQNQRIDGIYKFRIMNDGETTALLGDNPLSATDPMDMLKRELSGNRLPKTFVVIPESEHIPNVLEPGKSFDLEVALGHYNNRVMKDPFPFCLHYMDTEGISYLAKVKIHPKNGDVLEDDT